MINKSKYDKLKIKPERVQSLIRQIDEQRVSISDAILNLKESIK